MHDYPNEVTMPIVTGYMNLYHSGFYHRRDKPDGNINVHGGDVYLSARDAELAIEPRAGFITTVVFQYEAKDDPVPNRNTFPLPLRETRRELEAGAAWLA